jgi:hypothetical protein
MGPDLWTAFVFFGFPLVLGLLGVNTGGRFCYRAYRQYTDEPVPERIDTDWASTEESSPERTWRGNALRGVPLLVGGGLLAAHSARWLVRFLGVL